MPLHAILKGQQKAAVIWSRNIAPSATAAISMGPKDMPSTYTKKGSQASRLYWRNRSKDNS